MLTVPGIYVIITLVNDYKEIVIFSAAMVRIAARSYGERIRRE